MTNRTKPTTAARTYADRAADIARLMDLLRGQLEAHAARANVRPDDWGYAGDLGRVRQGLVGLVADLRVQHPEQVEAELAGGQR